jgi:hypothetical protein
MNLAPIEKRFCSEVYFCRLHSALTTCRERCPFEKSTYRRAQRRALSASPCKLDTPLFVVRARLVQPTADPAPEIFAAGEEQC